MDFIFNFVIGLEIEYSCPKALNCSRRISGCVPLFHFYLSSTAQQPMYEWHFQLTVNVENEVSTSESYVSPEVSYFGTNDKTQKGNLPLFPISQQTIAKQGKQLNVDALATSPNTHSQMIICSLR